MWDLIVSVPDHCLSFYFEKQICSWFYYTPELVGHTAFGLLGFWASYLFMPHVTFKPCMLSS